MKRLLSCTSSEMLKMDGQELKQAILASEGRTVMTETVVAIEPLLGDLTNAELAVSFRSDMFLLSYMYIQESIIDYLFVLVILINKDIFHFSHQFVFASHLFVLKVHQFL